MPSFQLLQHQRHSVYQLGDQVQQRPEELYGLVKDAIRNTPSPYNTQLVRAVVLTGTAHQELWNMILTKVRSEIHDAKSLQQVQEKIENNFQSGFGTVLFLTDLDTVQALSNRFPKYEDKSEKTQGIAIYSVWLALTEAGLGASLQHYESFIGEWVHQRFNLPTQWRLRGEMPFGSIQQAAHAKDKMDSQQQFRLITNI